MYEVWKNDRATETQKGMLKFILSTRQLSLVSLGRCNDWHSSAITHRCYDLESHVPRVVPPIPHLNIGSNNRISAVFYGPRLSEYRNFGSEQSWPGEYYCVLSKYVMEA